MSKQKVRLIIHHPDLDPAEITRALGLEPTLAWKAGDARFTPVGTPLPGPHRSSLWQRAWADEVAFDLRIAEVAELLRPAEAFIATLIAAPYGRVTLNVDISGRENFGAVLPAETLGLLGRLGVNLGFEVFSDWA